YVEAFMNAARQLKVGEVSKPVQSQYGWHIIKVTDQKIPKLSDVKDKVENILVQQLLQSPQPIYDKLNKAGDIDVKDKEFKDLFKVEKQDKTDENSENKKTDENSQKNNANKSSNSDNQSKNKESKDN